MYYSSSYVSSIERKFTEIIPAYLAFLKSDIVANYEAKEIPLKPLG